MSAIGPHMRLAYGEAEMIADPFGEPQPPGPWECRRLVATPRRTASRPFVYVTRVRIAYPTQPYCPLSLGLPIEDVAQDQKRYWPKVSHRY